MNNKVRFRKPVKQDAKYIYELIKNSPPLDLNSVYYYLIFCTHFAETGIVAEIENQITGFISGYLKPDNHDTLFIWQVVVSKKARGNKIGGNMLSELLNRKALSNINYVETTVTPSNKSSKAMFQAFAKNVNADIKEEILFEKTSFGNGDHEDEVLLRIGPFNIN